MKKRGELTLVRMETAQNKPFTQVHNNSLSDQQFSISELDWEELLFDLRHVEVRILELLYIPKSKPLAFGTLVQKINKLNVCERTIRRKLERLEKRGLIKVVHSTISIINPIIEYEKNIKFLTVLWNHRDRNL